MNLSTEESGAVAFEAPVFTFQPAIGIEAIKVILPVEVKIACLYVIFLNFYVVVASVPGHIRVISVILPRRPGWCPEIHHQVLSFVLEQHIICVFRASHHLPIKFPLDIGRCPFDNVFVKVRARLETLLVGVILLLPRPDYIHTERCILHRRHQLNVNLVPALHAPVWTTPECKECANSPHLA